MLPVVRRELAVAARRRTVYRVRSLGAVVAVGLGSWFLVATLLPGGLSPTGRGLFFFLMLGGFGWAVLSGVLLTADCLSRERREGTLGLLFLTDLGGFDIVAGKLAALSLVPLHGLLAAFPVGALTVMLGGVTGGELWRGYLAIVNTMFLSLAVGMWRSSRSRDDRQAVAWTLAVLAVLTVVPALVGVPLANSRSIGASVPGLSHLQLVSPAETLLRAFEDRYRAGSRGFWVCLALQHGVAWLLLLSASWTVRRVWRSNGATGETASDAPAGKRGLIGRRPRVRKVRPRKAGDLALLGERGELVRAGAWWTVGVTAVMSVGLFVWLAGHQSKQEAGSLAMTGVALGLYSLKVLVAIQAVYAAQDNCRAGTMELLLITPVSSEVLCESHLGALRRAFLRPFLVLAVVQVGLGIAGRVVAGGDWPSTAAMVLAGVGPALVTLAVHALDFVAVAYYALNCAFTYDRPSKALARTILVVLVLPGLFCSYARAVVDVLVLGQVRPRLDRFRDLVRGWYFPGPVAVHFGAPRSP